MRSRWLDRYADPAKAAVLQRFFKTGPGQYGAGDVFVGVTVPQTRQVARQQMAMSRENIERLLQSPIHEERMLALLILVEQFRRGTVAQRRAVVTLYLGQTARINNWDLVDLTADKILGHWLENRSRRPLYRLAVSKNIWERRIAIVSTFHFIRQGEYGDTLALAEILLHDQHELIHKAVGWMLREVGKRDEAVLRQFLDAHAAVMPRTMLRYAIERLSPAARARYMKLTR